MTGERGVLSGGASGIMSGQQSDTPEPSAPIDPLSNPPGSLSSLGTIGMAFSDSMRIFKSGQLHTWAANFGGALFHLLASNKLPGQKTSKQCEKLGLVAWYEPPPELGDAVADLRGSAAFL